jgi:hypothetical protein
MDYGALGCDPISLDCITMFGSFPPSLRSLSNHSLPGSEEPTLLWCSKATCHSNG